MAEIPSPEKTTFDLLPPSSPANSTSEHAIPSGYGNLSCSSTIKAVLRGTIKNTPNKPPQRAITAISQKEGFSHKPSFAHIKIAGMVKIAPAANDSPADPIVCTILFSKMESFLRITRRTPMDITAAGIEAETVIPTRSPR